MFRLSGSIDDVLDNLREFAREWHLYGVGGAEPLHAVLEAIVEVIVHLEHAIGGIRRRPTDIRRAVLAAKKAGNRVRYPYQDALAELFGGELDTDVLRQREAPSPARRRRPPPGRGRRCPRRLRRQAHLH